MKIMLIHSIFVSKPPYNYFSGKTMFIRIAFSCYLTIAWRNLERIKKSRAFRKLHRKDLLEKYLILLQGNKFKVYSSDVKIQIK
jgi:hypothetical protein